MMRSSTKDKEAAMAKSYQSSKYEGEMAGQTGNGRLRRQWKGDDEELFE